MESFLQCHIYVWCNVYMDKRKKWKCTLAYIYYIYKYIKTNLSIPT